MSVPNQAGQSRSLLSSILGLLGMSGVAGVLVTVLVAPLIAVTGVAANSTITLFESLPDYLEIGALQQKTELYAKQGGQDVKFAEFYSQNREEVPLDQISPYVIDAAVSAEDPRFYEHGGVDVISAGRALVESVLKKGGAGASTITMQYVRNVRVQAAEAILDPAQREAAYEEATDQTPGRKLQEMRLAIGVEKQYSKEQILQGYFNIALFGGTVYGIESAAQYYFGKKAIDLTLPEAASLVAIVQDPNTYRLDFAENVAGNKERRDYVLRRMAEEGKITDAERDAAQATPVEPHITPTKHGCMNAGGNAQYFCDYVQKVILNDPAFGETFDERLFNFRTKGYQIYTTIDLDTQAVAQQSLSDYVPAAVDFTDIGAAVSMVEPGTGRILAMAQNTQFDETEAAASTPGLTSVNYNTDYEYGGSTGFQVGSTYKIFTLAEWLSAGHSLGQSVNAQTRTFNQSNFRNSCLGSDGGSWPVSNDGGAKVGSVTALQATVNSYNTAYAAMAEQLDQCRIRDTAMALGAHRADGAVNESNPAAVLGTNTIAPLSMATAIAGLAAGGKSCSPIAIDSIKLRDGSDVAPPKSTCTQAVTPEVAAGVNYALEATANGGTAAPSNPGLAPMTGKTGTTDSAVQTWIVGSTTKAGMAVWVGNAEGNASLYNFTLGGVTANQARHSIFRPIMAHAEQAYGGDAFPSPPESATKGEQVTMPDLAGRTTAEAQQVLEQLGFTVSVGRPVDSSQPAGTVASTLPSANTRVNAGTTVTITPSNGNKPQGSIEVPDLTGKTPDEALQTLKGLGFAGTINQHTEASTSVPAGTIIRTDPVDGGSLQPNGTIQIWIAG